MATYRIYYTGVGGQGTLTATTLLSRTAMHQGVEVTSGEIHGMAQRGGVVESFSLLGGLKSPKIALGEADILLGFEPLETLRGLPMLRPGGLVLSNSEFIAPIAVSMGKASCPTLDHVKVKAEACADKAWFLPCRTLGLKAGAVQAGNIALLGAFLAVGGLPFGPEALEATIRKTMKPKLVDMNLKAMELGIEAVRQAS